MPSFSRARWVFAASLVVSGCAVVSGLDQFEKGDAETSLDATPDQTVSDVGADSPTIDSGDAGQPDAPGDVVTSDVQDGGVPDDASDSGCGATNTITNCSTCGAACDTSNATSTQCTGTTCQYACKTGFSNCDAAAPDLNGCECPTPMCCGAGCAVTHQVGVNALKYYDCVDAGTYDQTQAAKACTAYTGNQFLCGLATCTNDAGDPLMCGNPDGGGCACWGYGGTSSGHVHLSGNTSCFCPNTNDPSWN